MATNDDRIIYSDDDGSAYTLSSGVKIMPCKYNCGGMFIVSTRTRIAPHHLACGIKAAVACSKQMHEHHGPYYDAWLMAMAHWIARLQWDDELTLGDPRLDQ